MIGFHRVLIGTAIVFCAGFCTWSLVTYRDSGSVPLLLLALSFGVAAGVLSYYLRHLNRFLHR